MWEIPVQKGEWVPPKKRREGRLAEEQQVQRPACRRQPGALRMKLGECQSFGVQVRSGLPSQEKHLLLPQSGNSRDSAFTEGVKEAPLHPSHLLSFPPSTCFLPTWVRAQNSD